MRRLTVRGSVLTAVLTAFLAACTDRPGPVAQVAPPAPPPPAPTSRVTGPVLASDGRCEGPAPTGAVAIAPGIGECELVRLKGAPPTDVLVGESGRGSREVQVLYAEPTGKELYFFVDNRLDRIVR